MTKDKLPEWLGGDFIKSLIPQGFVALGFGILGEKLRELTAAILTQAYTQQVYFYQTDVWEIFQSYLNGLKPKPTEEGETD